MDRVYSCGQRDAHDALDVEVGLNRRQPFADQIGLGHLESMQGEAIFLRIDCNAIDIELGGRTHYANSYLTAIGDQDFLDWLHTGSLWLVSKSALRQAPSLWLLRIMAETGAGRKLCARFAADAIRSACALPVRLGSAARKSPEAKSTGAASQ